MKLKTSQERFAKINIEYQSTLMNYSSMIVFLGIFILIHLWILFLYKVTGWRDKVKHHILEKRSTPFYKITFWARVMVNTYTFFNYNFYITLFKEIFLFIMISWVYEIAHPDTGSVFSLMSCIISIILIGLICYSWITIWVYVYKSGDETQVPGPFELLFIGINIK